MILFFSKKMVLITKNRRFKYSKVYKKHINIFDYIILLT